MKKALSFLSLAALVLALAGLTACEPGVPVPPAHFSIVSVSGPHTAKGLTGARAFNGTLPIAVGDIDSGSPDYLVFTLKKIVLVGGPFADPNNLNSQTIWEDATGVDITVQGNGEIDLTGVADIGTLPVGTVTGVKITVASQARIRGTLEAVFVDHAAMTQSVSGTVYTKAAYTYDAITRTGGTADWHDFETAPAEETTVSFVGGDNGGSLDRELLFPVSDTLEAGDSRAFTILFDVSRTLRFYDGLGGGTGSPDDLSTSAYFYSHSVLTNSIVCFFGDPGMIQGYSTLYDAGVLNVAAGWMTLIYDSTGNIQSGLLIGDDDGSVINKGLVGPVTVSGSTFDFSFSKGLPADYYQVVVTGFTKVSALQGTTDAAWAKNWHRTGLQTVTDSGDARFTLRLEL